MFDLNDLNFPVADIEPHPLLYSFSDTQFDVLKKYIQEYESSLDSDHEVALMFTNFGQTIIMQVTEIGYEKSVALIFKGYVGGKMSTLVQHVNQLNLLLTSVDKDPVRQKTPIGFQYPSRK